MIVESYEDVIVLSGPLKSNHWETVETAIELLLKRHPPGVIVDCSNITEITEQGAQTFQHAIDFVLRQEGARIIFAAVPSHVAVTLRNVKEVRSQLALANSVEDARRSLDLMETDPSRRKREFKRAADSTILAVALPGCYTESFVKFTEEFLSTMAAKCVLGVPIVVPRELPLQAPMPEQEMAAVAFMRLVEKRLVEKGVPCEFKLERTRDVATLVDEMATSVNASHVLVSLPEDHREDEESSKLFFSLMEKINRSIAFVRGAVASE